MLSELGKLYYSLVWEGTVLLALCSDNDLLPADSEFGKADLAKLLPKLASSPKDMDTDSNSSVGVTAAMEGLSTADFAATLGQTAVNEEASGSETTTAAAETSSSSQAASSGKKTSSSATNNQMKQIRPLLNVSSRLAHYITSHILTPMITCADIRVLDVQNFMMIQLCRVGVS